MKLKAELLKYRNYLVLIVALIFLRIFVQPYSAWLVEAIERQRVDMTQLTKIENLVLSRTEILAFSEQASTQRNQLEAGFKEKEDGDSFRLTQQQYIQSLFQLYDITIDNIGWLSLIESPETLVAIFPLEVQFKGEMSRFVELAWELESQGKGTLIRDMSLSVRGQNEDTLGFVRGRIVITFFASVQ